MTKQYLIDGGTDFDPSEQTHRVTYSIEEGELPSTTVVMAVAAVTNTLWVDLDPLYVVIDPDHLDGVFTEANDAIGTETSFTYNDCDVTVSRDEIRISVATNDIDE